MDKVIWKYEIDTTDMVGFDMPKDSQILCIQMQNDTPCIWALVDPNAELENRVFFIYGTGHDISYPDKKNYIGTYQLYKGSLVFHLFELKE